jgi:hypothetical protein
VRLVFGSEFLGVNTDNTLVALARELPTNQFLLLSGIPEDALRSEHLIPHYLLQKQFISLEVLHITPEGHINGCIYATRDDLFARINGQGSWLDATQNMGKTGSVDMRRLRSGPFGVRTCEFLDELCEKECSDVFTLTAMNRHSIQRLMQILQGSKPRNRRRRHRHQGQDVQPQRILPVEHPDNDLSVLAPDEFYLADELGGIDFCD